MFYYPRYGEAVQAFSNSNKCPIFSMTSTKVFSKGASFEILFTGDSQGVITLYFVDVENRTFTSIKSVKGGDYPITVSKITTNKLLITGNTNGELRFWSFSVSSHYNKFGVLLPRFRFDLKRDLLDAHCGAVEVCIIIGDIILTSGGNDGLLVGWDVSSNKKMGSIICHQGISIQIPGRQNRRTLKCCPVSASLLRGKLMILCRDGYLTEWNYGVIEESRA